jgi:hypothetical protein
MLIDQTPDRTPFRFEIEAEMFEKTNSRGESETWVGGICTTDHVDQEGERLLQEGLDFNPFMDHGFFNDNHGKDTGAAVGKPAHIELRNLPGGHKGWYVEGPLYQNSRAKAIKELATDLARSGDANRSLGFSVEGAILERSPDNPKDVKRAVVREVAITRCPVNRHTTLQKLAKSLAVGTVGGEPGGAQPLMPESLEGIAVPGPGKKKKKKKKMKKSEAIDFLMDKHAGLDRRHAEMIVDYTLRNNP